MIELPVLGINLDNAADFKAPIFANALRNGGDSGDISTDGGKTWTPLGPSVPSKLFNVATGLPKSLGSAAWRCEIHPINQSYYKRPATWPRLSDWAAGLYCLTWQGTADVRIEGSDVVFVPAGSVAQTGVATDGIRFYRLKSPRPITHVVVRDQQTEITRLECFYPDPESPQTKTLRGQDWYPAMLPYLRECGVLRAMSSGQTNHSPQKDWADRRRPRHFRGNGVLNRRDGCDGLTWIDSKGVTRNASRDQVTGLSWEHQIALANEVGADLWICVPHLATDDYITKLAQTCAYGASSTAPYAGPQKSPTYAPLRGRLWVTYSNECWNSMFQQWRWLELTAKAKGTDRTTLWGQMLARTFALVEQVFPRDRLVKVAEVWTGLPSVSKRMLSALKAAGQEPDVIAGTIYYGNKIQQWVLDKATAQDGTDDPWFMRNGLPISHTDPYWLGEDHQRHLVEAFDEWDRRQAASDGLSSGPDATGWAGGFKPELKVLADTAFSTPKPLVAYEGGQSIYTDDYDNDALTIFVESMTRHPRIEQSYRMHLDFARAKGIATIAPYKVSGGWSKNGQWGHVESWGIPSRRWDALMKYRDEAV